MADQWSGPDPHVAASAGWSEAPARKGFFTDTSICIGCKACEVACKEWNGVPDDGFNLLGSSYDNTGALGASTWRHVAFIEQPKPLGAQDPGIAGTPVGPPATDVLNAAADRAMSGDRGQLGTDSTQVSVGETSGTTSAGTMSAGTMSAGTMSAGTMSAGTMSAGTMSAGIMSAGTTSARTVSAGTVPLGMPTTTLPGAAMDAASRTDFRWLMSSDVCKHCTHAACLDVCPTGSLFRTEFGTVVVQDDICNGCGYCVPACPFGVIDRRIGDKHAVANVGIAQKCTLCYDRLGAGHEPACAQACPTQSIQFGDVDELRERAAARVAALHTAGVADARLYGADPDDGVGGSGAFFLLLDEPEVYGLPPDPVVTTRDLPEMWRTAGIAAVSLLVAAIGSFVGRRR